MSKNKHKTSKRDHELRTTLVTQEINSDSKVSTGNSNVSTKDKNDYE